MSNFEECLTNTGGGYDFVERTLMQKLIDMFMHAPTRRALHVGCGLMLIQQFCGINAVIYYASAIYQLVGFNEATSIWLNCVTALSQMLGQFLSITLVESVGR